MNSQPGSPVYDYFVNGVVNAKNVAPWYNHNIRNFQDQENLSDLIVDLSIQPMSPTDSNSDLSRPPPQVRYLLDVTLNRLCRWLRILGIDAALETDEQERMRTKDGKMYVPILIGNDIPTYHTSRSQTDVISPQCIFVFFQGHF